MIRRNTFRPIDRLDSRHLLSIILCIGENGGCRKVDIYENVSWNTNMPKKIRELMEMGIIDDPQSDDDGVLRLTPFGMTIYTALKFMEESMTMHGLDAPVE